MIRINNNYLDKFKKFNESYNYMVAPGLWLTFDKHNLEYVCNTLFYEVYNRPNYLKIEKMCNEKIDRLIALDVLEVID